MDCAVPACPPPTRLGGRGGDGEGRKGGLEHGKEGLRAFRTDTWSQKSEPREAARVYREALQSGWVPLDGPWEGTVS